ncbi:GAF domain-containing protein [Chloroflexota bacterium]
MSAFLLISEVLASPQGSFVYHFLLLLVMGAALGMALGDWRYSGRSQARHLMIAMGALMLVRLPYILAALVSSAGWVSPVVLLPPLERFADTASVAILGWAFIPPMRRSLRVWDLVFGANLILALVATMGFIISWGLALVVDPSLNYNATWQSTVWAVWQMVLILLAGLAAVRYQTVGWGAFLVALLVMFLGRPLQMVNPAAVPNLPVWERLANLVAYSLVAVAVYRNIIASLRAESRQLQDISQASLDEIRSMLFLLEASQEVSNSLNPSTVLENAVWAVARVVEADQCGIVFPTEEDPAQVQLSAVYTPRRQGRGESVIFPLEYQLAVQQAMRRKKAVILDESDNVQLQVLFSFLGSSEIGPILIQPLLYEGEAVGAVVVGNALSQRPFTVTEAKLCEHLAKHIVGALLNGQRYQRAQERIEELHRTLEAERRTSQQAKIQVRELSARLVSLQAQARKPGEDSD